MTRAGFVMANLGRRKTRTILTLLSIVTAFLLFGLLQAVNVLFSAGADFNAQVQRGAEQLLPHERSHAMYEPFLSVLDIEVPVIAALNGHAFAGGAMLAMAHDLRVMRDDRGYWCLPEADLGLPLTPVMHGVVAAKLPCVTAHEAIITGRRYTAAQALEAQIVHQTAAEADVLDAAVALAEPLTGKGVIAEHKQLLYGHVAALLP